MSLSADTVFRLAGQTDPVQLAQAGGGAGQIGAVTELAGSVSVTRVDGSAVQAQVGTPIFQDDILETTSTGEVKIEFADGSDIALGANGRAVIDTFVYDPNVSGGEMSVSFIKGVFSFASGDIARSGDDAMQLSTPVATMGIRGTTGVGSENEVILLRDADGTVGEILVFNAAGSITLTQPLQSTTIAGVNVPPGQPVLVTQDYLQSRYTADVFSAILSVINRNEAGDDASGDDGGETDGDDDGSEPSGDDTENEDTGSLENQEAPEFALDPEVIAEDVAIEDIEEGEADLEELTPEEEEALAEALAESLDLADIATAAGPGADQAGDGTTPGATDPQTPATPVTPPGTVDVFEITVPATTPAGEVGQTSLTLGEDSLGSVSDGGIGGGGAGPAAPPAPPAAAPAEEETVVVEVNAAPTFVFVGPVPFSIDENEAGATVGTVFGTDPDGDELTFSTSTPGFEIVGGELKLVGGTALDHEALGPDSTIDVTLTATDPDGLSITIDRHDPGQRYQRSADRNRVVERVDR